MEKYCKSCGRVFKNSDFKICPYCGNQLSTREGRQPIPRKLRHQVFQRDGYRCRECGATNKQTRLHVDHIKPVAKGGTNDLSNLQTLCESCNLAKYTDEWVGGEINNNINVKKTIQNNLTLEEKINLALTKFSEGYSIKEVSKVLKIQVYDIYEWYSKGKHSAGRYGEFYEKINKFNPEISQEIEQNIQKRLDNTNRYQHRKNQKTKKPKPKKLSLDEITHRLNEFSEWDSARVVSKALNVPINDIYEWYSKGKQSINEYVEFYEKINIFTPKIAKEIESYYQRIEKYEKLRLKYANE